VERASHDYERKVPSIAGNLDHVDIHIQNLIHGNALLVTPRKHDTEIRSGETLVTHIYQENADLVKKVYHQEVLITQENLDLLPH
jgi:hypothetical protein